MPTECPGHSGVAHCQMPRVFGGRAPHNARGIRGSCTTECPRGIQGWCATCPGHFGVVYHRMPGAFGGSLENLSISSGQAEADQKWECRSRFVQPVAFGVSFLQSQISIHDLFFKSLLPRSVEKRPMRLRLEIEIQWHSECNRLLQGSRSRLVVGIQKPLLLVKEIYIYEKRPIYMKTNLRVLALGKQKPISSRDIEATITRKRDLHTRKETYIYENKFTCVSVREVEADQQQGCRSHYYS